MKSKINNYLYISNKIHIANTQEELEDCKDLIQDFHDKHSDLEIQNCLIDQYQIAQRCMNISIEDNITLKDVFQ